MSKSASQVSADRIARADRPPTRVTGDDAFSASEAVISNPGYPSRTPAERERAAVLEAEQTAKARRVTLRILMGTHACQEPSCRVPGPGESAEDVAARHPIGGHGCAGPGCGLPGHEEAAGKVPEYLMGLGLVRDPVTPEPGARAYRWGAAE